MGGDVPALDLPPHYHGTIAALARQYPLLGRGLQVHEAMRGTPLSFRGKPYLIELYADARDLGELVVRKAVQTGVSEWALQVLFDAAGWRGRVVAYVLPTYAVRNRFVQTRVNPLLQRIPAYRDRSPSGVIGEATAGSQRGQGNLALKRFGPGALLFLGSGTDNDFTEFSADVMIVDEYDRCDLGNLALARDRLRESPYPQQFYISNPTLPGVGIDRLYDQSDRRRWFHRCDACGERQPLDWFRHVVERADDGTWRLRDAGWRATGDARPLCQRCHRPFARTPDGALWVAEDRGRPTRGYHLSRLDVLTDRLADLFLEWQQAQGVPELVRAFYASVLGLAYQFEGTRVTDQHLLDAASAPEMDWAGGDAYRGQIVTAGVDVGGVLHVRISVVGRGPDELPRREARWVGTVRTFEELADLLRRFHVRCCVVDADPETHKASELRDQFLHGPEGLDVWLCRFQPTPRIGPQKFGMRLRWQSREVQVDRTAAFDAAFADLVDGRSTYPGDVFAVTGWAEQMKAPIRVVDEAGARIVWSKGPADHHRLADVYDRVAAELLDQGGSFFTSDR